jgi:hypothetical protein
MAKMKLEIATDNAAFGEEPGQELALILREIANHLEAGMNPKAYFTAPIRDTNGNTVGKYSYIK